MPATATAARWDAQAAVAAELAAGADATRTALYGGLVGEMIGELEQSMVAGAALARPDADGTDLAHRVSVAAGYLGLAAGCAATVLGAASLF